MKIKSETCGVYLIENKLNGKRYVGSSVDVRARILQHFTPSCYELYPTSEFYKDIKKLGNEAFSYELLEITTKENKIKREQYWFDKLNPEYNFIRPRENNFEDPKIIKKAQKRSNSKEAIERRKRLYNTPEYKELFKKCHPNMKSVDMYKNDELIKTFQSIRETARWLDENTEYTGINKFSKVKAVCDRERPTAYGYTFEYSNKSVETNL